MMYTGIIRTVDTLGRVVIPIELRSKLGINPGDGLEFLLDNNRIVLQKNLTSCLFCGTTKDLRSFCGKPVCRQCINRIGKEE